jgi:sigma-B regulation protein RsbU (phosphoserine phosphatase)
MLFGAAGALAILAVFSLREPPLVGWRPAIASLLGFVGLGILGGVALARSRRSEAERQRAALDAQAAAFAREQLELARELQQRLLPPSSLQTNHYRVTASNVPAVYVAGDFYDFVPLGPDRLLIVLADVAGKGVGAGLIMATVKAIVPLLAAEQPQPASLLGRLNDQLADQLAQREFVAMILALYDAQLGTLTIANAGLPDPVVLPSLRPIAVEGPRYPIGIRKNLSYESLMVNVAPGDRVIFFTDGLPEATVGGEPLGYERLSIEVERAQGEIARLFSSLENLGAAHDDDWTAVLLERLR